MKNKGSNVPGKNKDPIIEVLHGCGLKMSMEKVYGNTYTYFLDGHNLHGICPRCRRTLYKKDVVKSIRYIR